MPPFASDHNHADRNTAEIARRKMAGRFSEYSSGITRTGRYATPAVMASTVRIEKRNAPPTIPDRRAAQTPP